MFDPVPLNWWVLAALAICVGACIGVDLVVAARRDRLDRAARDRAGGRAWAAPAAARRRGDRHVAVSVASFCRAVAGSHSRWSA